ncbi:MAG: hypothetical protein Q7R40_03920 [Phaeospirillum sp.]|nr:hypothetical protein [Phaeospirillum sp.]
MASIVDIFGTFTDSRSYKQALSPEKALLIMANEMMPGLDPNMMKIFKEMLLDVRANAVVH